MKRMKNDKLLRAWGLLLLLSTISTGVAVMIDRGEIPEILGVPEAAGVTGVTGGMGATGLINVAAGVVILGLALIKGRIILSRYLGLDATRFWRHGFNLGLTIYTLVLLVLYLAPFGGAFHTR